MIYTSCMKYWVTMASTSALIVHIASGFPLPQEWDCAQHRREMRHGKVFLRVLAFLRGGIQLLPGSTLTIGLSMESPVLRKGEFKVWKMLIKTWRIIRRMAYLSGDWENEKCRNFDKCAWKLDVTRKRRLGDDMIALPGVFKCQGLWKTL